MENAAVRMSLKFVVKNGYHRDKLFLPEFENPPCQTAPQTGAGLQRKPPQMGSLLVIKKPSAVNVCASLGSCPQVSAIVCKCACLCSVIACHHFTLLIAISARAESGRVLLGPSST